jgi:hypothetical protein
MSRKPEVLAALGGLADLQELVPSSVLERFHLAEPMQYGVVCREVRHGIERLEALGAGPFLHATTHPPGWKERGVARKAKTEIALGYCAGQQIELLGPGENTHFYAEKIPADGGFALHHVGIAQLGLENTRRAFAEAGVEAVVEMGMKVGPFYSVDVAYYDTRDEIGFYLELLEFRALGGHTPFSE